MTCLSALALPEFAACELQVRAEKPAWYLAVISGALLRTLDFVSARSAEYLGYLEKGQLPPARLTLTAFEESFVLEGAGPVLVSLRACVPSYLSLSMPWHELGRKRAPHAWMLYRSAQPKHIDMLLSRT